MGLEVAGALVAGTGLGTTTEALPGVKIIVPTRFGIVKGKLVKSNGSNVLCLNRHSAGHKVPPHRVTYLAVAEACRILNVPQCVASAAVGSLNSNWTVGDFVLCEDFIDLSARRITAHADAVHHEDFTHPFDPLLGRRIMDIAAGASQKIAVGGIYANVDGPRYETPSEIRAFGAIGANLVGMTAGSEAIAMKELGIKYACVAVVTNSAAGMGDVELQHHDVVAVMNERGRTMLQILLAVAAGELGA